MIATSPAFKLLPAALKRLYIWFATDKPPEPDHDNVGQDRNVGIVDQRTSTNDDDLEFLSVGCGTGQSYAERAGKSCGTGSEHGGLFCASGSLRPFLPEKIQGFIGIRGCQLVGDDIPNYRLFARVRVPGTAGPY